VAGNLPATGTVILTMPYTPLRRPHIVNKLTFFLRQVIRETNALLLICYSMIKNESFVLHRCHVLGGASKMFCVAVFYSFAHCHFFLWTGKSAIEFGQSSVDP
jgi:hypothetical protein